MAPKYKLTYFDIKGLAEPIRYLLSYGGVDFEDNRISKDEWAKMKPSTPYGKMPLLEVDGKVVYQSSAICRYLAKQFNLLGSNDWEALQVDATVDTITDLRLAIAGASFEEDKGAKAKKLETLEKETLPLYLSKLDKQVKDNGGHFIGGKVCTHCHLSFLFLRTDILLSVHRIEIAYMTAHCRLQCIIRTNSEKLSM
ncbi:glutathione S-transferase-like isoform X1 [Anabrus simplex]|uniref:glutathione S-transferase-like isoform X1 n=1 Tax=Anabrus simplex TaxID=316456 RepID=UPI0035A2D8EA